MAKVGRSFSKTAPDRANETGPFDLFFLTYNRSNVGAKLMARQARDEKITAATLIN